MKGTALLNLVVTMPVQVTYESHFHLSQLLSCLLFKMFLCSLVR